PALLDLRQQRLDDLVGLPGADQGDEPDGEAVAQVDEDGRGVTEGVLGAVLLLPAADAIGGAVAVEGVSVLVDGDHPFPAAQGAGAERSEERRVGKEGRARGWR